MSIDNIIAKILSDAIEHADKSVSEAAQKAEVITAQAKEEAIAIKKQLAEQGTADAVITKHRKQSLAELEARKIRLAARQKAVSNAMEAAINHLANMEHDEYIAFLAKQIVATGAKSGQLLLNSKDKVAVGEKLVTTANALTEGGNITLSDQTINARGGFILKCGSVEINATIETLINLIRESVTPDVVAILFQE